MNKMFPDHCFLAGLVACWVRCLQLTLEEQKVQPKLGSTELLLSWTSEHLPCPTGDVGVCGARQRLDQAPPFTHIKARIAVVAHTYLAFTYESTIWNPESKRSGQADKL